MKKILHKLKKLNKQIAEFEAELVNINAWTEHTAYDKSQKRQQIEKHEHFIAELKETKVELLKALQAECGIEIKTLKTQLYDNAPNNHETQPSFS